MGDLELNLLFNFGRHRYALYRVGSERSTSLLIRRERGDDLIEARMAASRANRSKKISRESAAWLASFRLEQTV